MTKANTGTIPCYALILVTDREAITIAASPMIWHELDTLGATWELLRGNPDSRNLLPPPPEGVGLWAWMGAAAPTVCPDCEVACDSPYPCSRLQGTWHRYDRSAIVPGNNHELLPIQRVSAGLALRRLGLELAPLSLDG